VIVEYIRYLIPAERAVEFEDAYRRAGAILTADEHCLRHEVSRGVENPDRYVVRIEWDSVEGHEQGFRKSVAFAEFFALVKPFFAAIEEMTHYQPTPTA
jgi:quinol monooxygenase YgiN